jgi:hypothetical protein
MEQNSNSREISPDDDRVEFARSNEKGRYSKEGSKYRKKRIPVWVMVNTPVMVLILIAGGLKWVEYNKIKDRNFSSCFGFFYDCEQESPEAIKYEENPPVQKPEEFAYVQPVNYVTEDIRVEETPIERVNNVQTEVKEVNHLCDFWKIQTPSDRQRQKVAENCR